MTTLTIEVPDDLMTKLIRQQRPIQEVVINTLENVFGDGGGIAPSTEPSTEEVIRHLYQIGFLSDLDSSDDPIADEWDALPDYEKQMHLQEVDELVLMDSALSHYIIESRR